MKIIAITPLKAIPYGNAKVIRYDNGAIRLVSYTTPVVDIDAKGLMYIHGLYSATTRKHISAFMREFTKYDYYTAKRCYEKNIVMRVR